MSNLDSEEVVLLLMRRINAVEDVFFALLAAMANTRAGMPEPMHQVAEEILFLRDLPEVERQANEILQDGAASETQRRTRSLLSKAGGDRTVSIGPADLETPEPPLPGTA